ncbi:GAF and ANTAR domain-containing protein [Kribbella catacumbae]|uniref:GAF and ANTAR domain-containing protein n=1 Tax=Kribbella catacumbae TaxID=460086 RepID=UPI00037D06C3|nr:GAF and ANTAR domain-containing protein [Kribbella catacumbae]
MLRDDLIPPSEEERLAALRRYDVLDTPQDGAFDRITALAARYLQAPISVVSLVDADRIWFKSHHGLDIDQTGRDPGLCASAILQGEPWEISDAAVDPRALLNPLVTGELGLRFYLGIPLTTHDHHNLGTLCVIDREPRQATADQIDTLSDLAEIVMDEMELRLSARRLVALEEQARLDVEALAAAAQREADTLQGGIDTNRQIGQALGLLMERYQIDADRAFEVLKRYSQDSNRKLVIVAEELILTRELPPDPQASSNQEDR